MKKSMSLAQLFFFSLLLILFSNNTVIAEQETQFQCGGGVEKELWALWDSNIRNYLDKQLLHNVLVKQGNVYALYNFQLYTNNMVSMARRCNRLDRLQEVSRLIRIAYDALETTDSSGRQWICRGGPICNNKNGLINKEVMLCSAQFLGLASSVANALATSGAPISDEDKVFIRDTFQIVNEHLLRWNDDASLAAIQKAAKATAQDVKTGSSDLFFLDRHLWLITIYAEIAGILESQNIKNASLIGLSDGIKTRFSQHISALLQFFLARISIQHDPNSRIGNADLADLDRGYWRLYFDNRYAGYEKSEKPVECLPSPASKAKYKMEVRVTVDTVQKRQDIGWDISHARRLVTALDALERNHEAMKKVFSLSDAQLPSSSLASAFANTLVAVVWNGDTTEPLFKNYWSGANGWYRVAYDNKTGQCREGDPPYGLADSFLTGGYIAWERYRPAIGLLGQRLYDLVSSPEGESSQFIVKNYSSLSISEKVQKKNLSKFMFLPSLIGNIKK